MAPIFVYLPETAGERLFNHQCWNLLISTGYYAARGLHDQGRATLQRVNGKVSGYDVEMEYSVILNTIEEERSTHGDAEVIGMRQILRSYVECFKGVNLVRTNCLLD